MLASRLAGSTCMPTPGCATLTTTRPMIRAMVETASKYSSAMPPVLPTAFMLCMPAIPVTTVQKMIGAMAILISFTKPSPRGFMVTATCG
ncbi:hypothetical protein D9M73_197270 [compost metagenome]